MHLVTNIVLIKSQAMGKTQKLNRKKRLLSVDPTPILLTKLVWLIKFELPDLISETHIHK
jgi:hypothetical protein